LVERTTSRGKPTKELRRFIRIVPSRPVPVRLPDGNVREDIVVDISPAGMQIHCDEATAAIIHPLDEPLGVDSLPNIDLEITLPVTGKNAAVTVKCKLCFVKNMPDGKVSIGMAFEDFKEEVSEYFQRFVRECLEPPPESLRGP